MICKKWIQLQWSSGYCGVPPYLIMNYYCCRAISIMCGHIVQTHSKHTTFLILVMDLKNIILGRTKHWSSLISWIHNCFLHMANTSLSLPEPMDIDLLGSQMIKSPVKPSHLCALEILAWGWQCIKNLENIKTNGPGTYGSFGDSD